MIILLIRTRNLFFATYDAIRFAKLTICFVLNWFANCKYIKYSNFSHNAISYLPRLLRKYIVMPSTIARRQRLRSITLRTSLRSSLKPLTQNRENTNFENTTTNLIHEHANYYHRNRFRENGVNRIFLTPTAAGNRIALQRWHENDFVPKRGKLHITYTWHFNSYKI